MRIVFMGTPVFAAATLRAVHAAAHDVLAVYTQPPRPAGRRGLDLVASPVQLLAEELNLPVRSPISLKDSDEQSAFRALQADCAVVVAYGLLLPQAILDAPRFGCLNGHASLLPRWRGAAPIQRAIMAGDAETGMTIMRMEAGLDTGPICLEAPLRIEASMTAGDLHDRLMPLGADLMVEALVRLEARDLPQRAQSDSGAVYAAKIDKAETRIDWSRTALEIDRSIRGLSPMPGAWCEILVRSRPERLKLLRSRTADGEGAPGQVLSNAPLIVACGAGAVELLEVQRAGGRPMSAEAFLAGLPEKPDRLS